VADEVKPWPTWVRYPLIAVFAVVVVVGLVLAVTSGVDNALWRIVIAAVLIPAVLIPLQRWGLRRRARRTGDQRP
jgi:predicted lysophospholipase L1 biosynthesis ABC-type transport system permease subunit